MKTRELILLCILWLVFLFAGLGVVCAGDIAKNAVPAGINYQGRLEKDNAPVTGPVYVRFRIYSALTGGFLRWENPETEGLKVTATQGVFNAQLAVPWSVLSSAEQKYLEVQIEDQVLSPREPLQSVMYSLVAKKIEDGADLTVSALTAGYQVLLATYSGNVGIGTVTPDQKLVISGNMKIIGTGNGIYFQDGSFMNASGIVSAGNLTHTSDAVIVTNSDAIGGGDLIVYTRPTVERLRLLDANGNVGISTGAPSEKLEINGNMANSSGNFVIFPQDRLVTRPKTQDIGIFRVLPRRDGFDDGSRMEIYRMTDAAGQTSDPASFTRGVMAMTSGGFEMFSESGGAGVDTPLVFSTGGSERLRIDTSGIISAGSDFSSASGLKGGNVSAGAYSQWPGALSNELRSASGTHLIFQQSNALNVGIGITAPSEKLHVNGNIRSDYGVVAATGVFSGGVTINGDLNATSVMGNKVYLSSTIIYGTLEVTGGIGSEQGLPVYLNSTQTITGLNIFTNQLSVASHTVIAGRQGVGMAAFNLVLPGSKYLQVGSGLIVAEDARQYLVSGSGANAVLSFYRGSSEASRIQTAAGSNLAFVTNGSTRAVITAAGNLGLGTESPSALLDVRGGSVRISTSAAGSPSIYVHPTDGNVGIGTNVLSPNNMLTVAGDVRISTATYGLIFPDGSFMVSAGSGSYTSVSSNIDAIIRADADSNGTGSVVLRVGALDGVVLRPGTGNVGIGTLTPSSRLNVIGGDVLIGNPVNPYSGDAKEDIIVGGDFVLDGNFIHRGVGTSVQFESLSVAYNVFLSTLSGSVGIGTASPGQKLDVQGGSINTSGSLMTGNTARISATGVVGSGGANATWDGATIAVNRGGTGAASLTSYGVLYGNGTAAVGATAAGTANYLLQSNGGISAPSWVQATDSSVNSTIVKRDASGDFSAGTITADITGNVTTASNLAGGANGSIPYQTGAGATSMLGAGTAGYLLQTNGAAVPTWVQATDSSVNSTIVKRGASGNFSAGTITADVTGNVSGTAANVTGIVAVANGGTGSNLSGTGGANQFVKQSSVGGAFAVGSITDADVPNTITLSNITQITASDHVDLTAGIGTNTHAQIDTHISAASAHSATSLNTASRIVMRDASGNFSAGTITADLNGNANTATKPAVAGPFPKVACWKGDGSLGSCSDAPGPGGGCTCN
ncbi:MAG: hypothetical protein ABIG11_08720 [bacterium]